MEAELLTLASVAGTALVNVLASETWERGRDAVVGLWRRVQPGRTADVESDLAEDRELLRTATGRQQDGSRQGSEGTISDTDVDPLREAAVDAWRARFVRLLARHPELAPELRRMVDEELTVPTRSPDHQPSVVFNASPSGNARVYQSARDQHITER
ncbi:hypothetical protein ACIGO6_21965 [Streptomyces sp. NPDC053750]|uniref:hypothetical protein n=1 Tax=Streptomyces sp. NPDC053750 TaxID=3365714 RepID=UPI0037D069E0